MNDVARNENGMMGEEKLRRQKNVFIKMRRVGKE